MHMWGTKSSLQVFNLYLGDSMIPEHISVIELLPWSCGPWRSVRWWSSATHRTGLVGNGTTFSARVLASPWA